MKVNKVLSLLIVFAMILSLFGSVSVFADETGMETTVTKTYYYDSFENGEIKYASGVENYVSSTADAEANGIFAFSSNARWTKGPVSLVNGAGYDGGKAAYINYPDTPGTGALGSMPAVTKTLTATESNAFMFQYKIKIADYGTGTQAGALQIASIGNASGSTYWQNNGCFSSTMSAKPLTENKWYTVICLAEYVPNDGNSANDNTTSGQSDNENYVRGTVKIIDEEGNVVKTGSSTESIWASGQRDSKEFTFIPMYAMDANQTSYCNGFKAYLDDFSLIEYSKNSAPAIYTKRTNISDGATDVSLTPEFKLSFDMDIATIDTGAVKLYKADDINSTVNVTLSTPIGGMLTVTPASLEENEEYVLDFSGVKSVAGTPVGTNGKITFTTSVDTIKAISTTIGVYGGAVDAGKYTVTVVNHGEELTGVILVAAVYDNGRPHELLGCEILEGITLSEGENQLELTFEQDYSNVASVRIMMLDAWSDLNSLMDSYDVVN